MCLIHEEASVDNLGLIQTDAEVHEDRGEQTVHRLPLRLSPLERLHLQTDQVVSEDSPKVRPCNLIRLWQVAQTDQLSRPKVKKCELLYPRLVGLHLAQENVGKDPHEVAQGGVADIRLGGLCRVKKICTQYALELGESGKSRDLGAEHRRALTSRSRRGR